jgi:tellurite methyltransferase
MQRTIRSFAQDDLGDWVVLLDCGHRQHMRHRPPFVVRAWITSAEGRTAHLEQPLECPLCDRFEWPANLVAYKRTPEFTADTIPAGLRKDHSTKSGVWGRIVIIEGALRYQIDALNTSFELTPEVTGIVVPQMLHHVAPRGAVLLCRVLSVNSSHHKGMKARNVTTISISVIPGEAAPAAQTRDPWTREVQDGSRISAAHFPG